VTRVRRSLVRVGAVALAWLAAAAALAQQPDPLQLLAQAKAATGGAAWDALRSQHSRVVFKAGKLEGNVERWASLTTGRSLTRYDIGPASGAQGFDGFVAWSQQASGATQVETDDAARELAVNAAYRDRLAFWFPDRQPARIDYARRDRAEGIDYDVVRIVPEGGRAFELWIGMLTQRIERLVEDEGAGARTEIYGDFRTVQGVTLPFRVRIERAGAPDGQYVVDRIEYNVALDDVDFGVPPPLPGDVLFAAGRDVVDVPFEVRSGHVFIEAKLDGKGPFRMLFDAGGASVLVPSTVAALGLSPRRAGGEHDVALVPIERVDVGGVAFERQTFAVIDVAPVMRRVEGLDDVAGIVGYDVVSRLPVRIDYEHSKLSLHRPRAFVPPAGAVRVPFVLNGRVPQVRARVDGVEGAFDVDTGSRASLTLAPAFVERNDLVRKYGSVRDVVAGAGAAGRTRALLARAGRLSIASVDVEAPVTYLSKQAIGASADVAGNIGYGVLRRFAVTLDYSRNALYLEKGAAFAERDVHDRAGVWLERGERGFDVVDVVADGPARAAGIAAGDVIVAVDGKPAKSLALSDVRALLRGAPGTKVRLRPERNRKPASEVVVVLRDLI
jgi:hypothetical protein